VYLGIEIVLVGPPSIERLEHLLDLFLEGLNERRLILHAEIGCLIQVIALDRLPLPLSLQLVVEET
jgi:hypothetical protein